MADQNEALRLDEPPNIANLKKIAASNSTTALRNGLRAAIKWVQCLEMSLKFEQAASFREQVAELEAERDTLLAEVERTSNNRDMWKGQCEQQAGQLGQLRAEVERLRADAERLNHIEKHARCDPKMDGQHVWWPTNFKHALRGNTLRAAIDNAIVGASNADKA